MDAYTEWYENLYIIIDTIMDVTQMLGANPKTIGIPVRPANPDLETRDPVIKPEHGVPHVVPEPTNSLGQEPLPNTDPIPQSTETVVEPTADISSGEPAPTSDVVDTSQPPITVQEVKDIEREALDREEEKKEEVKKETVNATEEYKQQVFEFLIEEQTKLEIELEKSQKAMKYYKTAYEELAREHNALKYDDRKVAISEDYRPLVRLLEQFKHTPDDVNIKSRLIIQLLDTASMVDGNDYLSQTKKSNNQVNDLSKNISSYSNMGAEPTPQRKITGVVMPASKRGFR